MLLEILGKRLPSAVLNRDPVLCIYFSRDTVRRMTEQYDRYRKTILAIMVLYFVKCVVFFDAKTNARFLTR